MKLFIFPKFVIIGVEYMGLKNQENWEFILLFNLSLITNKIPANVSQKKLKLGI